MNNTKTFKIVYYLCSILTLLYIIILSKTISIYMSQAPIQTFANYLLGIINLILLIIVSISLIKKKELQNTNILFPIIHLLFFSIVIIISILYNSKLIIPYIQFGYYLSFILFNYLLLNIYTLLSIKK